MKAIEYSKIKTRTDLLNERRRIGSAMAQLEMELHEDYNRINGTFSLSYITERLLEKTNAIYTFVRYAVSVYRLLSNIFSEDHATEAKARRHTSRHRRRHVNHSNKRIKKPENRPLI